MDPHGMPRGDRLAVMTAVDITGDLHWAAGLGEQGRASARGWDLSEQLP